MILTGNEIRAQLERGRIQISNFDPDALSPNAYDLKLAPCLTRSIGEPLDPMVAPARQEKIVMSHEGFLLEPNDFWLGESQEEIRSDEFVPMLHARSGTARLGLFVHITGDLLQLGFNGHPTFQLYSTLPLRLHPGVPIAQISFWRPHGHIDRRLGRRSTHQ